MGMSNQISNCPICGGIDIKNNENSSIDAFEFYCNNCTKKYYLILSHSELKLFRNLLINYKEELLNFFNQDESRPINNPPPFDCHWPLTFKDIKLALNIYN
jgi:hypothetical protein